LVEVNEEIARAYFEEVCGYMVRTGFYYKKFREKREGKKRGGAGPADIDLLIMHPNPAAKQYMDFVKKYGKRAMVSVKGWHMEPKRRRDLESALEEMDNACSSLFADCQASDSAEAFFGSSDFRKLLVISRLDENFKEKQKEYAKQKYKVEPIIEFQEILEKLMEQARSRARTYFPESPILQTIYTMSKYIIPEKDDGTDHT
jgi:hypothetical protein